MCSTTKSQDSAHSTPCPPKSSSSPHPNSHASLCQLWDAVVTARPTSRPCSIRPGSSGDQCQTRGRPGGSLVVREHGEPTSPWVGMVSVAQPLVHWVTDDWKGMRAQGTSCASVSRLGGSTASLRNPGPQGGWEVGVKREQLERGREGEGALEWGWVADWTFSECRERLLPTPPDKRWREGHSGAHAESTLEMQLSIWRPAGATWDFSSREGPVWSRVPSPAPRTSMGSVESHSQT